MKEGEEQDNPTLFDIARENPDMTYNEVTKVQEDLRLKKEGVCITGALKRDLSKGKEDREVKPVSLTESQQKQEELEPIKNEYDYHRYWKDMYEKEHKLRQEAQGETTIVKGIGMNSPEMKDLQARVKELDNSLSIALEINEKHQRYNGKLQVRLTEVEEDNKKLSAQIEDKVDVMRKAGL
tara:strand:- start:80 stop:622 length:543 start_codon:yes stop_codon:yes gene_type:complete